MNNKVAPENSTTTPVVTTVDSLVENAPILGVTDGSSIEDELQNNSNMFRDEAKMEASLQEDERRESRTSLIARILGKEEPKIRMVGPLRTKSVIKRYTTEVWDPRSTGRLRWDAVVVVCVLYNCLVLPFRIGFGDDEFGPLSILELMVDLLERLALSLEPAPSENVS